MGNCLVARNETGSPRQREKRPRLYADGVEHSMPLNGIQEINPVWIGGQVIKEKGLETLQRCWVLY